MEDTLASVSSSGLRPPELHLSQFRSEITLTLLSRLGLADQLISAAIYDAKSADGLIHVPGHAKTVETFGHRNSDSSAHRQGVSASCPVTENARNETFHARHNG